MIKHKPKIIGICFGIRGCRRIVICHIFAGEENTHQRADLIDMHTVSCGMAHRIRQHRCIFLQPHINIRICLQNTKCGKPCSRSNRIAGKCSCLINRTVRGNHTHDILSSTIRADRHTSTNNLSKRGQIRRNMKILLCSAQCQTKAGDDLVKDEKCPVMFCDLTQKLQESVCRRNNAHICSHRFHDDCCDLIRISLKQCLDAVLQPVYVW